MTWNTLDELFAWIKLHVLPANFDKEYREYLDYCEKYGLCEDGTPDPRCSNDQDDWKLE